jgi:hypothetical protein
VSDVQGVFGNITNKEVFAELFRGNPNASFEDVLCLARKGADGHDISCPVYEYKGVPNRKTAEAEPLFGYTAVRDLNRRGKKVDWSSVLLGEGLDGEPLFSQIDKEKAKSAGNISFQENTVHNMIAASRSGKGVLTMNSLGSACEGYFTC